MKCLLATLAIALGSSLAAAPASARDVSTTWTSINASAPRSIFDQIRDTAPRTVFDDIRDSAPLQPVFDTLQDNAP